MAFLTGGFVYEGEQVQEGQSSGKIIKFAD